MICACIHHKSLQEILDILEDDWVEMAEIRLDSCPLSEEEIRSLFSGSDKALIATCRGEDGDWNKVIRRLGAAIEAGAGFADLELEAPVGASKEFRRLCRDNGCQAIRSFHDFGGTPDAGYLMQVMERCFRYGADIAKIVTTCHDAADAERIGGLYGMTTEDGIAIEPQRLIAFGMGEAGRQTRLDCLRKGSPLTYCAVDGEEGTAPGQWSVSEMYGAVYGERDAFHGKDMKVCASKSFAQRAILAAALAEGTSELRDYSPCDDSEAALKVAEALGATVTRGETLTIKGIGPLKEKLHIPEIFSGESGLLTRMLIPVMCAVNEGEFTVNGEKTLLKRPLGGAADIMASFGVLMRSDKVPVTLAGPLIPGTAEVSGKSGSQLISGLLMALPLCEKDSTLFVSEPKSIPYMFITVEVLRKFGIRISSEMEGDGEKLSEQDWSGCDSVVFKLRGGQRYKAASFGIEADWSAAANLLVAGAISGSAEIKGLDLSSLQADLSIIDILVDAGASVSSTEDGYTCVRKAPLEAFEADLNNAPDLFPIVAVLAAFCAGKSSILGLGRLATKESNRAEAITDMLTQLGVEHSVDGDALLVSGKPLARRILEGSLLEGGEYTSRHDHRMAMALKVASLGTKSPVIIDDEACVGKSFPGFFDLYYSAF